MKARQSVDASGACDACAARNTRVAKYRIQRVVSKANGRKKNMYEMWYMAPKQCCVESFSLNHFFVWLGTLYTS